MDDNSLTVLHEIRPIHKKGFFKQLNWICSVRQKFNCEHFRPKLCKSIKHTCI